MKRLLPVLAALFAVLLVGGCGDSSSGSVGAGAAAEVNGQEISQDVLLGQLEAAANIEGYGSGVLGLQQEVAGESPGTYNTDASAEVLTTLIVFELMDQELADLGVEVTEEDRASVEDSLAQALGTDPATGQPDPATGAEALEKLSADDKAVIIDGLAAASVLGQELTSDTEVAEVTDEDVRAAYDADPETYTAEESCVRHILVAAGDPSTGAEATPEESEAARVAAESLAAELDAGADFQTLATEESDDTGSATKGGDLGCNAAGSFVPEFEDAATALEIDQVSDPVQTQFGYHLIQVYERRTPTFEDVAPDIRTQLETEAQTAVDESSQQAFEEWYSKALTSAKVSVDPRYGTWGFFVVDEETGEQSEVDDAADAQFARVVPPGGPTTTTVATVPADQQTIPLDGG